MATSVVGQFITRVDGSLKVTGHAPYAVEHDIPGLVYGYGVASTIGAGRVKSIDSAAAEKMPGVLAVLHHGNVEPMFRPANAFEENSRAGESRPPFEDENIYYYGQFVALAVAKTFEQAMAAASAIRVDYEEKEPNVDLTGPNSKPEPHEAAKYSRGDAVGSFASAPVKFEATYTTPTETHNAMEMHGTIAVWKDKKLTLYETTQGVVNHHNVASEMLGVPLESIEVVSPFIGSGFGSKLFPWPHSFLAAVAARHVNLPVKVSVPRTLMFTTVGHRPHTHQRIQLGADNTGKLVALNHEILQATSMVDDYVENCVEVTSMLYSCPNLQATQKLVHLNIGTPTPMRGPGRTPSLFALESAMDELAIKLNIDPLEIRLRNYAEVDESSGKPWSSKHLREAYQLGAEKFGWSNRTPKVGSMKKGDEILGWGMATCNWPATRHAAEVRVTLLADGSARAVCATQDIGTGTYTVFAEIVSDKTGIPLNKIKVVLGDSALPPGPTSGGSSATATVVPAIAQASEAAVKAVFEVASRTDKSPFQNADPKTLAMTAGKVHLASSSPDSGVPFEEVIKLRRLASLDGHAKTDADPESKKFSTHCFGAHFCEVAYDPGIVKLRVTRWLTVMDAGRIINKKAATNQILGGVVMGIGMGLFEETVYDPRTGKPVNNNYADYLVSVNSDIPPMECIFLDYPDTKLNAYGAKGLGEIGLTGCASALAMATYHATGVRVRDLPIRIEKLMGESTA
jgi:xanthine dehydrogenase YagR molybdenum-binding subunit